MNQTQRKYLIERLQDVKSQKQTEIGTKYKRISKSMRDVIKEVAGKRSVKVSEIVDIVGSGYSDSERKLCDILSINYEEQVEKDKKTNDLNRELASKAHDALNAEFTAIQDKLMFGAEDKEALEFIETLKNFKF